MQEVLEILIDAGKDSLIVFPFLFAVYMLMEIIESAKNKERIESFLSSGSAPFIATAGGIIPECGFSVMCAKLYDKGLIRIGTLIAAFLATSDEGLIVLIANGNVKAFWFVILWKLVFATFIGFLLNACLTKLDNKHVCAQHGECIECGEYQEGIFHKFVAHPFYHAAKTFIYIFAVNLIFGALFTVIGEEAIYSAMQKSKAFEPLFASLFGIIPNCASSIILARAFSLNVISFAGLISGLAVNSGVGLLVLFKNKDKLKNNLSIVLILYLAGVVLGYLTYLCGGI